MPFTPNPRFTPGGPWPFDRRRRLVAYSRKWYIEELDRVCSFLIRALYPYCTACGEQRAHLLTCSHFYSRRFLWTRWDVRNLTTHCWRCNVRHSTNPNAYLTWLLSERGDVLSELNELRMSRMKIEDSQLRSWLEERRAQLAEATR